MPILRSAFIALSRNRTLRGFAERTRVGGKLSSRFVAGTEIEDALRVAALLNRLRIHVTLDSLGESVTDAEQARAAAAIYHRLLDEIAARKLDANISVKLTQMGLELDPALAGQIAEELATHAAATGNFVATFRRDGTRLFVKPGNNPEVPLNARTETRFQDPRGPIFEFQLDAQGRVTAAILEQGPQGANKTRLERK